MKNCIVETVKPHTIKKFELVETYVDGWARTLLEIKEASGIAFIDCMCNCGVYYDESGEKIDGTALRIAKKLNTINERYRKDVRIYLNDISNEKIEVLKAELVKQSLENVKIETNVGDANTYLKNLDIKQLSQHNTLLFYDPYQAMIDWDAVKPFLKIWGEVIINHMISDSIRGIGQVKKDEKIKKYEDFYGKSLEELHEIGNNKEALENIIREKIIAWIKEARKNAYVASFPFHIRTNQQIFNLLHCSSHSAGFNLFKRSAWKTFGGKSSTKTGGELEGQFEIDISSNNMNTFGTAETDGVYTVYDIANYIYEKYKREEEVLLDVVYRDLENHPIFPFRGYRPEVNRILKERYKAVITRNSIKFN